MFFDSTQEPEFEPREFEPLPVGVYAAIIVDAESIDRDGFPVLKLKLQVSSGDRAGAYIWDNIQLAGDNTRATGIGRGKLKKICEIIGKPILKSIEDLVGSSLAVRVCHNKKGDKTYVNVRFPEDYMLPSEAYSKKPLAGASKPSNMSWMA